MKSQPGCQEISVELPPSAVARLKGSSLGKRTLAEEAVRMLRYALRRMFPPRTPDEWRHAVKKEDLKELLQTFTRKSREGADQDLTDDQPCRVALEVSPDMAAKLEEIAGFKKITVPEATVYTVEYALTEVFPPKTNEELSKELRETWRGIFRAMRKRT